MSKERGKPGHDHEVMCPYSLNLSTSSTVLPSRARYTGSDQ